MILGLGRFARGHASTANRSRVSPSILSAIGLRGATSMGGKRAALMAGAAVAAMAVGAAAAPVYAADQGSPADGAGIRAGSFWFLQEYEFGGFYDSNVFAEPDDPQGGFGCYVQ